MAQAGRLHLHQHFAGAWTFELHFFDDERLIRAVHDGRADIQRHEGIPFENGVSESAGTLHHRLQVGLQRNPDVGLKPDLQPEKLDYSLHAG